MAGGQILPSPPSRTRNSEHHSLARIIPRPCKWGGGDVTPHEFFLEWLPNRWADHAEIMHSLWGIRCVAFGKKNDRVSSDHGARTS